MGQKPPPRDGDAAATTVAVSSKTLETMQDIGTSVKREEEACKIRAKEGKEYTEGCQCD